MSALSYLLVLAMMWGVVGAIFAVLFFPELRQAFRSSVQVNRRSALEHSHSHMPHHA